MKKNHEIHRRGGVTSPDYEAWRKHWKIISDAETAIRQSGNGMEYRMRGPAYRLWKMTHKKILA